MLENWTKCTVYEGQVASLIAMDYVRNRLSDGT